jgi:hypothetical protein
MSFKHWNDDQSIPVSMPLLDKYLDVFHNGRQPLKDVTMLFIQHQLGNQVPQAKALLALGLAPENLYWLDIPYTANKEVKNYLVEELKIPEKNLFNHTYSVLDAYAPYQRKRAQEVYKYFLENPPDKLIVLDDGAYFFEAMATFRKQLPRVAVVEQTTRGFIKIENNAALKYYSDNIPLVNVAKSKPKLTLEPPFIGYAVCKSLMARLEHTFIADSDKKCLILGYGAIGKQVADSISTLNIPKNNIYIYDNDPEKQKAAVQLGYQIWNRKMKLLFDLVIGCSGTSSFGIGDYVFLNNNAVLASASSGSVELSREEFIELAASHESDDIFLHTDNLIHENLHSDLLFTFLDKKALFLNGGFPVNFGGKVNCVPSHYIQSTMTLMVEAAVMASTLTIPGNHELNTEFVDWIEHAFIQTLAEMGEHISFKA